MAMNNFKCNHLMPLHFKGLTRLVSVFVVGSRGSRKKTAKIIWYF